MDHPSKDTNELRPGPLHTSGSTAARPDSSSGVRSEPQPGPCTPPDPLLRSLRV